MHIAWPTDIGERLESRFQYGIGIVYNTFPWPDATPAQRKKIETLAKKALDARARCPRTWPQASPSSTVPTPCLPSFTRRIANSTPLSTSFAGPARSAHGKVRRLRAQHPPLIPVPMRFDGTASYIATDDLKVAVNAAVTLRRPLLVKGEPGTGKTILAHEIAAAIGAPLIEWHVKSTTKAHQGLYEYDAVARLRDGQLGDPRVHDISNYIRRGKLWEAFTAPELPVLLIDEIDKADIEFPNDLLQELDRMEFHVYETKETIRAAERPIVIITSNNEKELPDAFLRRCFFHYIKFPDRETMQAIVDVHFPGIQTSLVQKAMDIFYQVREVPGLKKKPSTSELIDWLKLLLHEDLPLEVLQSRDPARAIPPLHGALLKNEQDVMLFERLAFMSRRQN
jgi:MoxR-like ATPase